MAVTTTFAGFSPEGIQFMADLATKNERAWFQPRKADYERLIKEPMESLMLALDEQFRARAIPLAAEVAVQDPHRGEHPLGRGPCRSR